jgi:hypothetical protein
LAFERLLGARGGDRAFGIRGLAVLWTIGRRGDRCGRRRSGGRVLDRRHLMGRTIADRVKLQKVVAGFTIDSEIQEEC